MIRMGLLGASGRMGTAVQKILAVEYRDKITLIDQPLEADVVIDFSLPAGGEAFLKRAAKAERVPALAVGSTGWQPAQIKLLEEYAKRAPVLFSANFSMGVLTLQHVLRQAAPLLTRLGYRAKISETHHIHKKDAPSGTALAIQKILGHDVPIHSHREGEIVGEHEVTFIGLSDRLKFSHSADERGIFARGAIQASLWLCKGHKPGSIYYMQSFFDDVLAGRWTP
jgi:4-hydroxy-tetrahydrodipicolinate reductase